MYCKEGGFDVKDIIRFLVLIDRLDFVSADLVGTYLYVLKNLPLNVMCVYVQHIWSCLCERPNF